MPELPEVESITQGLQPCVGKTITNIFLSGKNLRKPIPSDLINNINVKIISIVRKAKFCILSLNNGYSIILHFGMSGSALIKDSESIIEKHDHIIFYLENNLNITFNDHRRFGLCELIETSKLHESSSFKNIGIDALDENLTEEMFYELLQSSKQSIKQFLLNQKYIAGVGNIYACEALYESSIHPEKIANSITLEESKELLSRVKRILKESIIKGGSTLKDYKNPKGEKGSFQDEFKVYGREGLSCYKCQKNNIVCSIVRIAQNGRSTFYCKNNQKLVI